MRIAQNTAPDRQTIQKVAQETKPQENRFILSAQTEKATKGVQKGQNILNDQPLRSQQQQKTEQPTYPSQPIPLSKRQDQEITICTAAQYAEIFPSLYQQAVPDAQIYRNSHIQNPPATEYYNPEHRPTVYASITHRRDIKKHKGPGFIHHPKLTSGPTNYPQQNLARGPETFHQRPSDKLASSAPNQTPE